MEYFREPNNRIQAGFALRAGKLLEQYRTITANIQPAEKYDATLTICVLQSLLTNCIELLDAMRSRQKSIWSEIIPDIPRRWGIKRSHIVVNTFPSEVTYGDFLKHLRNALSHPTSPDKAPKHSTTGYTTLPDSSGIISQFRFTDSPWVDRGSIHSMASSSDFDKVQRTACAFERKHGVIGLEVKSNQYGKHEITLRNNFYLPIFEAKLPLATLTELAIELSNHLAQPTMENWDGISIKRLVG